MKSAPLLLIGTVMLCAGTPDAAEQMQLLRRAGDWLAAKSPAEGACYLGTPTVPANSSLFLKWFTQYPDSITMNISRDSWQVLEYKLLKLNIRFTGDVATTVVDGLAFGKSDGKGIAMFLKENHAFLENLSASKIMKVSFPDGSEPPWIVPLSGADEAVTAFKECMRTWVGNSNPKDAS